MNMPDIPTSRLNQIIDAVNRRYPKEAIGVRPGPEDVWYDAFWKNAVDHLAEYGVWPVFDMGEIEYGDPVLDIYGDD